MSYKETKIPKLNDIQIMLILKNALDYNAEIVKAASFIYGQDIKESHRQRLYRDFKKLAVEYSDKIVSILDEEENK